MVPESATPLPSITPNASALSAPKYVSERNRSRVSVSCQKLGVFVRTTQCCRFFPLPSIGTHLTTRLRLRFFALIPLLFFGTKRMPRCINKWSTIFVHAQGHRKRPCPFSFTSVEYATRHSPCTDVPGLSKLTLCSGQSEHEAPEQKVSEACANPGPYLSHICARHIAGRHTKGGHSLNIRRQTARKHGAWAKTQS